MSNTRESGFYWTFLKIWCVCYFNSTFGEWLIPGHIERVYDSYWKEIDERPIVREEKELPGVPVE